MTKSLLSVTMLYNMEIVELRSNSWKYITDFCSCSLVSFHEYILKACSLKYRSLSLTATTYSYYTQKLKYILKKRTMAGYDHYGEA